MLMKITQDEAAKRIIVCGVDDVSRHLDIYDVGLIIQCATTPSNLTEEDLYRNLPFIEPSDDPQLIEKELIDRAVNFLIHNPQQHLLIHCNLGTERSPLFALKILHSIEGQNPNWQKLLKTLNMIQPNLGSYVVRQASGALGLDKGIGSNFVLAKYLGQIYRETQSFEFALQNAREKTGLNLPKEQAIDLCDVFGIMLEEKPKDTAPCGADNDRPERTPSLPRTQVFHANQHRGRDGPL